METTTDLQQAIPDCSNGSFSTTPAPFEQEMVTITRQEYIELSAQKNYWEAQHAKAQEKIKKLEQKIQFKEGQIKDLRKRLFGKKSEKKNSPKSEKKMRINLPIAPEDNNKIVPDMDGLIDLIYLLLMRNMTYRTKRKNARNVVCHILLTPLWTRKVK